MKNLICKLILSLTLVAALLAAGLSAAVELPETGSPTACIFPDDDVQA